MARNNFKRLAEDESNRYPSAPPEIKSRIQTEVGVFQMVGQIVEVYLPRVVELFIYMAGGDPEKMRNNFRSGQHQTDIRGANLEMDERFIDSTLPPEDLPPPGGPSNPEQNDQD